jgi:nucleoside transporter
MIVGEAAGAGLNEKAVETALNAARSASPVFFHVAGVAAFLLGLFSFVLPHTPPPAAGQRVRARDVLGLDALPLLRSRSFTIFLVCSFLICIPLAAYYAYAGMYLGKVGVAAEWVPRVMTFGQISEVAFMLLMPLLFVRLGVRRMLLIGMLAWVVRYGLFSWAWPSGGEGSRAAAAMVIAGIVLHGICYDFFFVTGQVFVDQRANPRIRAQAQGLLVLVTQGLGLGIGAQVMGAIVKANTTSDVADTTVTITDWRWVWVWPCVMAAAVLVAFFALFRDGRNGSSTAGEQGREARA